ncbi:MAG: polysaccharide biosynthesis/export family protein [Deltaproteobacteria bacterium]|nr:polysaccharide biosynthesis/export family protein [Deltaproteobacteria bacterium]
MNRPNRLLLCLSLVVAGLHSGCASVGAFIWVDELPRAEAAKGYVIASGDSLNVRVWNQDAMSAKVKVRSDGQITLPLLNDVDAAGYTPAVLAGQLQTRLKDFINNPVVTVALEETRPISVPVLGEIVKPGLVPVEPGTGLIPVLAAAGGLTEWAKGDRIFVIRPGNPPMRIRFRLESLTHAEGAAGTFQLQAGDQIVVE